LNDSQTPEQQALSSNGLTQRRKGGEDANEREMTENELSHEIIGAAIEVHKQLGGPGLLEDVYEEALKYELELRGLKVARQVGFLDLLQGQTTSQASRG
jgi:hypothetical protein